MLFSERASVHVPQRRERYRTLHVDGSERSYHVSFILYMELCVKARWQPIVLAVLLQPLL